MLKETVILVSSRVKFDHLERLLRVTFSSLTSPGMKVCVSQLRVGGKVCAEQGVRARASTHVRESAGESKCVCEAKCASVRKCVSGRARARESVCDTKCV